MSLGVAPPITDEEWIASTQGCCGVEPAAGAVHAGLAGALARFDVNEYAASVRVYAVKPG